MPNENMITPNTVDPPVKMPTIKAMVEMASATVAALTAERTETRKRRDELNKKIKSLNDDIRQANRVASALKPRQSKPKGAVK